MARSGRAGGHDGPAVAAVSGSTGGARARVGGALWTALSRAMHSATESRRTRNSAGFLQCGQVRAALVCCELAGALAASVAFGGVSKSCSRRSVRRCSGWSSPKLRTSRCRDSAQGYGQRSVDDGRSWTAAWWQWVRALKLAHPSRAPAEDANSSSRCFARNWSSFVASRARSKSRREPGFSITAIGLDPVTRLHRHERRRDHFALRPPSVSAPSKERSRWDLLRSKP